MKRQTVKTHASAKIPSRAVAFSKKWENAKGEKQESQSFLKEFLDIFEIEFIPSEQFEYKVYDDSGALKGWVDCLVKGKIAIEMKSRGKNLDDAFQQLKEKYIQYLSEEDIPKILMVCDFETIILDFGKKTFHFKTKELRKHLDLFNCLLENEEDPNLRENIEANVKAAEKMAKLHDALKACGYSQHDLEVYLVRLLFCLFAQDTNIFNKHSFLEYVKSSKKDGSDLSLKIARLFEVLNLSDKERVKRTNLPPELLNFQYINGGLFADHLSFADFNEKMRSTLIECASFDWSHISPAIFGAMFQGVMDKDYRREVGAHYTSEENILKLINPLFMDSLWEEFERVKDKPMKLEAFHIKIANLKFLDPACGCGNFLIIAYRELRKLELEVLKRNDALKKKRGKSTQLKINIWWNLLRVNVEQFYGIEYEKFPCQIARVGMWLTDHQMNLEASDYFGEYYARLPLIQSATIEHGNALRMDWENVVPKKELSYILGNPPFVGASMMSAEQKADAVAIFGKIKLSNSIDYVGAWFHKAAAYIKNTQIKVAFVSTNSITQGEQVAPLWGKMFDEYNVSIDFGYRTFKWGNEAKGKAAVHCVIMGFSVSQHSKPLPQEISIFEDENYFGVREPSRPVYGQYKVVYESDGTQIRARNINPYLVDAPNVLITSRSKPICDVPIMSLGNKPTDGGNFILTAKEKKDLISKEPESKKFIKRYIGAEEFINGSERYCLWLKDVPYSALKSCPLVMERINKVKKFRLQSTAKPTVEKAETPHLFFFISHPNKNYLLIPSTSSENRRYIPIGYMDKNTISSNANMIIPQATLYHFGVLTSNVHMAWTRVVCGRLEMRYRYTGVIVYNNFPWPNTTDTQKAEIEKLAQAVLDARALYPESTLADMYGENSMPFHPKLVKAHQALDKAVMKLYRFGKGMSEAEIVAELMERYRELVIR